MIILTRKKGPLKIKEFRYPKKLEIDSNSDVTKIYSFKNFNENGWIKEKKVTMQIDLTKSEEELFKNMSKNYQKHIRREQREGIQIFKSDSEKDFEDFYTNLYVPLCRKNNLKPYPLDYMMQGLLWHAKKDGKMISGSIIFSDENNATQSFTASEHIEYNGNRLLIWAAIKYYKSKKLKWFNFGGGESDYKRRFGSEKREVWAYTRYVSNKAKILNRIRSLIKK